MLAPQTPGRIPLIVDLEQADDRIRTIRSASLSTSTLNSRIVGIPYPIKHLVVVMLENRSFDHLLGFLPGVDGLDPNWTNPLTPEGPQVQISPDARTVHDLIPDPGHEWIKLWHHWAAMFAIRHRRKYQRNGDPKY